ncbi:ABC transporter permease [Algivirga pacifica]|uniref:ABC transporter permease n=1 Tax=Algivirga pacifica TaxID=1162670 RepID=A0ABP9DKT5_9BACT
MITYIKLALHSLKAKPFFTFITLFGISLTITVLLVVGSLLDTTYGNYGMEKKMDHVLILEQLRVTREGDGRSSSRISYQAYERYFSKLKTPDKMALMNIFIGQEKLYSGHHTETIQRKEVNASFFEIFEPELLKGRLFTAEEVIQESKVVVITDALATILFGTEDPLGKQVKIKSQNFTVCGVVKKGNSLRSNSFADVYSPLTKLPSWGGNMSPHLGGYTLLLYFEDKAKLEEGRAEVHQMIASLPLTKENKEESISGTCLTNIEVPLNNLFRIQSSTAFYSIIIGVVLLFMALPAFNLVNINITRMMERSGEIGIRKAFGASTWSLVKQLLMENTVISLLGGMIGFVLAALGILMINYYQLLSVNEYLEMNLNLFLYGLLITLLFSVLSGTYPALKMARFEIIASLNSDKQ